MAVWFRLKNDEWHPNPEDWAAHADEYHETLTPRSDIPKLQHVQGLAEERNFTERTAAREDPQCSPCACLISAM
jgi:hypothetical protein